MTITLPEWAAYLIFGAVVVNAILAAVSLHYRIRIERRMKEKEDVC